jgi:hypothetical protein
MARTIIAVFESVYSAKKAVWELTDLGFPRKLIDIVAERSPGSMNGLTKSEKARSEIEVDDLRAGANIGAGIGGSLGMTVGILYGIGAMSFPPFLTDLGAGISKLLNSTGGFMASISALHIPASLAAFTSGPQAVAAFMLAAAFLCTTAGGVAGSLISALVGLGLSEEEIRQYAKNVHEGIVTVMIVADGEAVDGTLKVLGQHNPLEIKQNSIEWHKVGPREKKLAERALRVKATEQNRPH